MPDSAAPETAPPDVVAPESGAPDAMQPDAFPADTAVPDAAPHDAGGGRHTVLVNGLDITCSQRRGVHIAAGAEAAPLDGFPMLFDSSVEPSLQQALASVDHGGQVYSDLGWDILFAAADGQEVLKHEIERYDVQTGEYIGWVRVDLSGGEQLFYIYYGCLLPSGNTQHATEVWANGFLGVWHLNLSTSALLDSTVNGWQSSVRGATPLTDAVIAGGYSFDRVDNDEIEVLGSAGGITLDEFTVEAWSRTAMSNVPDELYVVSQAYDCDDVDAWQLVVTDDSGHRDELRFQVREGGSVDHEYGTVDVADLSWHHLAGVRDATHIHAYVDGAWIDSNTDGSGGAPITSLARLSVGRNPCYQSEGFGGDIDEVRITTVARTDEWLEASYKSMSSPATFYSIVD